MIKNYTLKTLQKAINQAFSWDETKLSQIASLQGKALKLIITPLQAHFFIRFAENELQLLADYEGYVDTTIQSSPLGFIRLNLLPASKARSLFNDEIRISGDAELGQAVKKLFDAIDMDWEGHLARLIGDVTAYQIGSFFRQGLLIKEQVRDSFRQNLTEYLQEELRVLPPREEIEDFFKNIDELSLNVERLSAQINQWLAHDETD